MKELRLDLKEGKQFGGGDVIVVFVFIVYKSFCKSGFWYGRQALRDHEVKKQNIPVSGSLRSIWSSVGRNLTQPGRLGMDGGSLQSLWGCSFRRP